jgi:bifunctional DNA primase/polymerase-like protein
VPGGRARSSLLGRVTMGDTHAAEGAFAQAALIYRRYGIATIPTGGPDGKRPLFKGWNNLRGPMSERLIRDLAHRYPRANVAMLPEISRDGITCADIDESDFIRPMGERFGPTPVRITTPRAGMHYDYAGLTRSTTLRDEGLPVDIKSMASIVLLPPSVRPSGPYAGRRYEFLECGIEDFARLPPIREGSLPPLPDYPAHVEGHRGIGLFETLRSVAREYGEDRQHAFEQEALYIARTYHPPYPQRKTLDTARSVWRWRLAHPKGAWKHNHTLVDNALLVGPLSDRAVRLYHVLKAAHPQQAGRADFAISDFAMARDQTIAGWYRQRYRSAVAELVASGLLVRTADPGRRSAARYRFGNILAVRQVDTMDVSAAPLPLLFDGAETMSTWSRWLMPWQRPAYDGNGTVLVGKLAGLRLVIRELREPGPKGETHEVIGTF